ncbi:MAG: hypothetical protein KJP20_11965 [Bacteroidia bacterium]|nr:hypothetical protein [Bacteroidia bacterium]
MANQLFKFNCRGCNQTSGIDGSIQDWNNDLDYYKNRTEYEISINIEQTMKNNENDCEFCGANNWDITDVRIDDYKLFNIDTINKKYAKKDSFIFAFEIMFKNGNGNLKKHNNTSPDLVTGFGKPLFEHRCKDEIIKIISSIPDSKCIHHHESSYLYFFFTGNKSEIKLEKFRHIGLKKEAMLSIIEQNLYYAHESMWEIGYD